MTIPIVLVGGFLGAGKTTLLSRAAEILMNRGLRVGIITNDQSSMLVDTRLAEGLGPETAVAEITGGCFCCRFQNFIEAACEVRDRGADIILAEPVGSCTDLLATVTRPLRMYHSRSFRLTPYTVLFDPTRSLGLMPESVRYLLHQQLLESDILVVNKTDVVSAQQLERALLEVSTVTAEERVLQVSASSGAGVETWLDSVLAEDPCWSRTVALDYEKYGEAEACLGWLNASGIVSHELTFSPSAWIDRCLTSLSSSASQERASVAHIKVLLEHDGAYTKASVTGDQGMISWDQRQLPDRLPTGRFILNVRLNADPELLGELTRQALHKAEEDLGVRCSIQAWECFSPAPPTPTYRLNAAGEAVPLDALR